MILFNTATFKATANTPIGTLTTEFEYDQHAQEYLLKKVARQKIAWGNDQKILRTYDVEVISVEKI